MDPSRSTPPSPLTSLLTCYSELNCSTIDILTEAPSALEFLRYVALNRPLVVRGGAADWAACRTWDVETLKHLLEGREVNVAVTPNGRADAPTRDEESGEVLFVKPWEELQDFASFIDFVIEQERSGNAGHEEVRYAQTQNDNLRNEYSTLFSHVEKDVPWARIALHNEPEAINLWIGNSRSVTAMHKDNYENIYVQVLGEKHFVLLPPVAYPMVEERDLGSASYVRRDGGLDIVREDGSVPFPTWDPDAGTAGDSEGQGNKYAEMMEPVRITLRKGDMLYLPALWYHKVSQSCSEEGICCAVNYWHDMEFSGSFYSLCNFVKSVAQSKENASDAGSEKCK